MQKKCLFEKRTSLESLFHISKTHFQENANFCNLVRRKMRNNSDSFSMWAGKKEVNNIFHFHRFLSASLTQKIFSEHLRENPKNRFYSENSLWSRFSYSTRGQLKKSRCLSLIPEIKYDIHPDVSDPRHENPHFRRALPSRRIPTPIHHGKFLQFWQHDDLHDFLYASSRFT